MPIGYILARVHLRCRSVLPITFLINDIKNAHGEYANIYSPNEYLHRDRKVIWATAPVVTGDVEALAFSSDDRDAHPGEKYSKAFFLDRFKRLIINLATKMPYERKVIKVAHDEIVVYGPV